MKTLIIPCAGGRMVSDQLLYLCKHPDGTPIFYKTIQGIFPQQYDRIVFIILDKDNQHYDARTRILQELSTHLPVEVLLLEHPTPGPAETVYQALLSAHIEGEIVIKDVHNFIALASPAEGNFVAGLDLQTVEQPIFSLRSKSFIVKNAQGQILDIVEKKLRSDDISVGLYGFRNAGDFILAYQALNDPNYPIQKLYISHLISYLIGYQQRVFTCLPVRAYEDWGSPAAWAQVQQRYATVFIDYEVFSKIMQEGEPIAKRMQQAQSRGMQFVFFSSQPVSSEAAIVAQLAQLGLGPVKLVCGCSASRVQQMVASRQDLEYCLAAVSL